MKTRILAIAALGLAFALTGCKSNPDPAALQALFDPGGNQALPTLDAVFDGLADYIGRYFEPDFLAGLIQPVQAQVQLKASNP